MRILDTQVVPHADSIRLAGRIQCGEGARDVDAYIDYREVEPAFVGSAPDALAAATLLPSMRIGEALDVLPPVSPQLAFSLPRIRDVFHAWWPELARIDVRVNARTASGKPALRAATFFSGGVDSFYSLLKHRSGAGTLPAPLTHLIFMGGVESRLEKSRDVERTEAWVREIARSTGVGAVIGSTNFRTTLQGAETNLHWERHYHGSALASMALGLSPGFGYVCIPSAFSYNHLVAHGSTALVDEMYSTDCTRVVHDGSEVSRATKVGRILQWDRDLVLSHLRVCIRNAGGAFNCGRCYKCVRTAVPLRVLGAWEDAKTFPDKSTDHWERTISRDHLELTEENLRFAKDHDADRELIAMLSRVVARKRRHDSVLQLVDNSPFRHWLPLVRRLRGSLRG